MLHIFFGFLIYFLFLSSQFVNVLVLIMLKSKHTDPTTSLFRAPGAKYDDNCNRGACLAYCTIRGPNLDFWTFMHTVPALLESQHTADVSFLVGCKERRYTVCSVKVKLVQRAYLDFMTNNYFVILRRYCPSVQGV